jgi:hypothetical protein
MSTGPSPTLSSKKEKARRGFPPGRNFGVSISRLYDLQHHVNAVDEKNKAGRKAVGSTLICGLGIACTASKP